jgi:3-phenylpropionate/trans-cinnamate dioxygenase ferredoxin subunit
VLRVRVGQRELAIANFNGSIHAVDNACTHAGGPLSDSRLKDGYLLECPWHSAAFDVRTGQVHCGPARKPLRVHQVKIENGVILVVP